MSDQAGASLSLWWHSNDRRGNILSVHPMKSMNITDPRYSKIHIMGQHNTGSHVNTSIAPTPTSNRVHNHTSSGENGLIWISGDIYQIKDHQVSDRLQNSSNGDVGEQQEMDFLLKEMLWITDSYFDQKWWLNDWFLSYKHTAFDFTRCELMDWSGVEYCDVFISRLDSHSDGTHSL